MGQATITCHCLKVRKISGAITKFYDRVLEPSGVTTRQYSLLLNLSKGQVLSVRELADLTELDRSTLTRNLKPLFHKGLIWDQKEPGARNSQLALTDQGRKTLEQARELWQKAQNSMTSQLGPENIAALERILEKLEA